MLAGNSSANEMVSKTQYSTVEFMLGGPAGTNPKMLMSDIHDRTITESIVEAKGI